MDCLSEKKLSSYLDEDISEDERIKIEAHLANCHRCLDFLLVAYDDGTKPRRYSPFGFKRKKTHLQGLKWLFPALFFFGMSFVVKRFFLQFLAVGVVLGLKWVMEGEGARRAIMIFKGIDTKEVQKKEYFERKTLIR